MLNNKTVQLCGKITDLEPTVAWENFNKAEALLKAKYPKIAVINPLRLCDHITEAFSGTDREPKYDHYLDVCKASLKSTDFLVTLADAHLSDGAVDEMRTSFQLGKEIIKLEDVL